MSSPIGAAAVAIGIAAFAIGYSRVVPAPPRQIASDCFHPLSRGSGRATVRTYAQALAEAKQYGQSGRCLLANSGRCGELRFTETGNGFVSRTEYFAGEQLVAMRAFTDDIGPDPECRAWTHYGQRVSCTEHVVERYCHRFKP